MDNRQKLGVILVFAGIMLYGAIHIATVIHIPSVTVWSDTWGQYFAAVSETHGWVGFILAILLFLVGALLLLTVFVSELPKSTMMQEIRERDHEFEEKCRNGRH
ncbi:MULTISPECIES: hypothetical protein [unclassified Paenibacillus]|uniref:hypothetical protein n=1 Tax=unclassified Paenibacillus TaxID=185978 RepID=UPI000CFCBDCC|nr:MULTISPECIES: hypothetical protein [unclassified Paenibacillus]PRA08590.1 hypothetical protein CQ043_00945 [Paenibacillus sp. MYb63]PRA48523.1 hypothetical protein CQ061_09400 [Paenibacillus sp. MYb67]QZN78432.1 hypothetical protein K5K90_15330 [Paenibacillus sp. DR312]